MLNVKSEKVRSCANVFKNQLYKLSYWIVVECT